MNDAVNFYDLPKFRQDRICKDLVKMIRRAFENPELQREYAEWKKKRDEERRLSEEATA